MEIVALLLDRGTTITKINHKTADKKRAALSYKYVILF
jgi:hypothetical protein